MLSVGAFLGQWGSLKVQYLVTKATNCCPGEAGLMSEGASLGCSLSKAGENAAGVPYC